MKFEDIVQEARSDSPLETETRKKLNRNNSDEAFLEQAFAGVDDDLEAATVPEKLAENQKEDNQGADFSDHVMEILPSIGQGIIKATQEVGNLAIDVGNMVGANMERFDYADDPNLVYQPETNTGKITSGIANFLVPFGAVNKAAKGIKTASMMGRITKAGALGAAVDFSAMDPHEERLSNLIQNYPALQNPISAYLAADKDDSAAEGRLKNALEGIGLGVGADFLFEAFPKALKAIKSRRVADSTLSDADEIIKRAEEKGLDLKGEEAEVNVQSIKDEIAKEKLPQLEDFDKRFDEAFIKGTELPEDEVAGNINLARIKNTDDVKKVIARTEKELGESGKKASNKELEELANEVGVTVSELTSREAGEIFSVEKVLASRKLLNTSAENVFSMHKKALSSGDEIDKIAFLNSLNKHQAIQQEVADLTSEAGRLLQSFNIQAGTLDSAGKARFLKDISNQYGGQAGVDEVIKRMDDLAKSGKDPSAILADLKKRTVGQTIRGALYESWINNILSGPKTHLVNMTSNSTVIATSLAESALGESFAKLRGATDSIQHGETRAMVDGMMGSISEAFMLARKTFSEGLPATAATKIDELPKEVLSTKSLMSNHPELEKVFMGEDGELNLFGRAIDFLGNAQRLPSRFLLAEDEFFKAVNYRMSVHQQATRRARLRQTAEQLSEEQTQSLIREFIDNPSVDIKANATEYAKEKTFTKDLKPGSFSSSLQNTIKKPIGNTGVAPLKVVLPFMRTPVNILQYALERTPLAGGKFLADLKAGGVAKDMALAKMGFGSGILGTIAFVGSGGMVTGRGPADPRARKMLEQTGWQPYSIKLGDNYVSYDRLDPFGQIVGMAADLGAVYDELDVDKQDESAELLGTALGIIVENAVPEMMTENLERFLEIFTPGRDRDKAVKDYMSNLAVSAVPFSGFFRNVRQITDDKKRETRSNNAFDTVYNRIANTIPFLSESLPPKRNLFGEEILYSGAISPLSVSSDKKDPVMARMVELGLNSSLTRKDADPGETFLVVDMPQRQINKSFSGKRVPVNLNAEQYDKYVQLSAGIGLNGFDKTLKEALGEEIKNKILTNAMGGSEEAEKKAIKQIISSYREAARVQFLQEDQTIMDEFMQESKARQDKFNPTNF